MRVTLEKVANIVVIASCLFAVGSVLWRNHDEKQPPGPYPAGSRIAAAPALGLKSAERTLILATSSACRFCVASLPFYRRLANAAKRGGTRIVGVAAEPASVNRAFLASHGAAPDASVSWRESGISVPQTPTLILVRRDGTVIGSWVGRLSGSQEGRVLSLVSGR